MTITQIKESALKIMNDKEMSQNIKIKHLNKLDKNIEIRSAFTTPFQNR